MHIYIDTDIAVVSSMQHYFPVWFNPPPNRDLRRCCACHAAAWRGAHHSHWRKTGRRCFGWCNCTIHMIIYVHDHNYHIYPMYCYMNNYCT